MTTAVQVQYRRNSVAALATFTGAAGELTVDTTNNRVVVQDGSTAGGFAAAKLSEVVTNTRTQVSDGNYAVLTTDRLVAYITLTAARTVSLPAASTFPTGSRLLVVDESGNCSATFTLTLSRAGSDLVNGATSAVIGTAYGYVALESNGANKWNIVDQVGTTLNGLSGVVSIAASDGAVVNASGSTVTIGGPGGLVNKFRNGTMDVWQRGTSGTVTTSGAYTADGWIVLPTGASAPWAQASGRLVTKNSLQVTGASSITDLIVKQRIESLIAAAFCSQTVTVQAQVYNGTGGSITPKLTVNRPSAQDNYGSVTADVNAVNLQACAASAWTLVSYTFVANAASYNGLEIAFDFGNNFGANTKTVQITELDIRVTPGAATGLNANPPPPELRPVAIELPLCQRYLYSEFPNLVNAPMGELGIAVTSGEIFGSVRFPATMRAVPALTVSAASDFLPLLANGGSAGAFSSVTQGGGATIDRTFLVASGSSGLTSGNASWLLAATTSARATFSAEL